MFNLLNTVFFISLSSRILFVTLSLLLKRRMDFYSDHVFIIAKAYKNAKFFFFPFQYCFIDKQYKLH